MAKKLTQKNYVITSAQAVGEYDNRRHNLKGSPNLNLLSGLEHYCNVNDAELVIFTMKGKDAREEDLHPTLADRKDLSYPESRRRTLNSNIALSDMIVPPQNVDPATGRARFVQRETSLIYASPKQRFVTIPASNNKLPKILATTGAVTHPNYNEVNHRGDTAARDHTYGAIVIEVIGDTFYNLRHLRAQQDGKFIDMGIKFNGNNKPSPAKSETLTLGDIHYGDHDEKAIQANYEMIEFFKPKRLFLHDFLNGHSVNPHERKNLMSRVQEFDKGRLDLELELKLAYKELCNLSKAMGKREVNLVYSNHGFFLDRYLESGLFVHEPWNAKIALKLAGLMAEGKDPVKEGLSMMGKIPSNVRFLELEDDYKVWGVQHASHGHKGLSGSRGSIRSREIAHGKSTSGHTHSPEIQRDTYIVGTSTRFDLSYTEGGANSWLAANAVLYEGGLRQLIPIIDGKWKGLNR